MSPLGFAEPFKVAELNVRSVGKFVMTIGAPDKTFKLNWAVPPEGVADIVIVEVPIGVVGEVWIVKIEEHVILQEVGEKEAVAPEGSPEAWKATDWVKPEVIVAVTEFDPDPP